jgi:hypothetical protein
MLFEVIQQAFHKNSLAKNSAQKKVTFSTKTLLSDEFIFMDQAKERNEKWC